MHSAPNQTLFLKFSLIVSAFGLFTIAALLFSPPTIQEAFPFRKPLIGSMFIVTCSLGIIAAVFPKKCVHSFEPSAAKFAASIDSGRKAAWTSRGHHPNCSKFSDHVIQVNGTFHCAACTGLFLGALLSIGGTALIFFAEVSVDSIRMIVASMGLIGIALGLIQFRFKGYLRLTVNALFVLSALFILAGIDSITKNMLIDLYAIALILFWLLARILISKWNNANICAACESCQIDSQYRRRRP